MGGGEMGERGERMTECVTEREREGVSRVCGGQGERD